MTLREPGVDGSSGVFDPYNNLGNAIDPTAPINTLVTVVGIMMSEDEEGNPNVAVDLNDFTLDLDIQLQRWMDNLSKQSVSPTLSSGSNTTTPLSGSTSTRPTNNLENGLQYFDTTLGKPIWWNGTDWVDSTGTTV